MKTPNFRPDQILIGLLGINLGVLIYMILITKDDDFRFIMILGLIGLLVGIVGMICELLDSA